MSIIAFCCLGDEDHVDSWELTTKRFGWQVFGEMEPYAGVLTAEEIRAAKPASGDGNPAIILNPAQFQQALDRAITIATRHGLPLPTPEILAEAVREWNEGSAQAKLEYEAAQPWVRRPAELLTVLQKMEQHLRATKADWYWEDEGRRRFEHDAQFAAIYTFLREASRLGKLVRWEYL